MSGTSFHRPREADLFPRQIIENRATALRQFRIKVAIRLDHRFGNLRQEGFV